MGPISGLLGASREVGARLTGYARLYNFLNAIGQTVGSDDCHQLRHDIFEKQVKPELCAMPDAAALGCSTPAAPLDARRRV